MIVPRRQTITKAAITRVVAGAQAAGLRIGRVEVEGGKIVIHSGEPSMGEPMPAATPREQWRARRGSR